METQLNGTQRMSLGGAIGGYLRQPDASLRDLLAYLKPLNEKQLRQVASQQGGSLEDLVAGRASLNGGGGLGSWGRRR